MPSGTTAKMRSLVMPDYATTFAARARSCGLFAAAMFLFLASVTPLALAQQVVVIVNGSPITTYDVEQRSKFFQLSQQKTPPRQEIIDELIDERIKLHEAKLYGMAATNAEVDRAVANMASRAGLSATEFNQVLASRGVSLDTVKARLRSEISWTQLVRARFPATLQIEETEIRAALAKKGESEDVAYDYTLRPIVFVVPKGSSSSVVQNRIREAEAMRTRFNNCNDSIAFAHGQRDVAVRNPVRRTSADLPQALREVLNTLPVGGITKPDVTDQGVQVFVLCEKTENKTDTPQRRNVRQELFSERFEARSKRYLEEVRRSSMIEYR